MHSYQTTQLKLLLCHVDSSGFTLFSVIDSSFLDDNLNVYQNTSSLLLNLYCICLKKGEKKLKTKRTFVLFNVQSSIEFGRITYFFNYKYKYSNT